MPKGLKQPINIYSVVGITGDYNIQLDEKIIEMETLDKPIEIKFTVLHDKDISNETVDGKVLKYSEKYLEIETETVLINLSNLKIFLQDNIEDEFYVKVVKKLEDKDQYRVNITSATNLKFENGELLITK